MGVLTAVGNILFACVIVVMIGATVVALPLGAEWLSRGITNFFLPSCAGMALGCLVILPFSFIKSIRLFVSSAYLFASFFFGLTAWLMGFSATLSFWGWMGVSIGLFFMGVGVVPMGIVALALNGFWRSAVLLAVGVLLTYGMRAFAIWLGEPADRRNYSEAPSVRQ